MPKMFSATLRVLWLAPLCTLIASPSAHAETVAEPVILFNTLPIKAAAFEGFLPVMQANAAASRKEAGNQSFDVFQPENGATNLYLLEHWHNQAALDLHMAQPSLKAVESRVGSDLAGEPSSLRLSAVPGLGADARKAFPAGGAAGSRNVIVVLSVKPDQEKAFVDALADVTPHARQTPGNHAFELYKVNGQDHTYVLFERWASAAQHEAHLGQDYSRRLDAVLPATLAAPVSEANRHLVKDVAAG
ncbi:Uncharacterized conserved protein [plant metagenome]|uniref:Uncharacterized conserved protein n=1 Tax=plant metagenome TaxID=1297885 RepID=A0A484SZ12_9ZZZZ